MSVFYKKLNDNDYRELRIVLRIMIESINDRIRNSSGKNLEFLQKEREIYSRLLDKIFLISLGE